jgi:hypothetical protein
MIETFYTSDPYVNQGTSTTALFQEHYRKMDSHPQYHMKTGASIKYDIQICAMFTGTMDEPPLWREQLLQSILLTATIGKVDGMHDKSGYPVPSGDSSVSSTASNSQQSRSRAEGQSFRTDSKNSQKPKMKARSPAR